MRRLAPLLAAGLVAACGAAEAPPVLAKDALPGLASRARTLDAAALAADALEPAELEDLLEEAEFVTGSEREFTGRTRTFDRVVARTLVFAHEEGAEAYLGWLRGHADELLGETRPERALPLGESSLLFTLVPCRTCKKELPTFLAGWRRGDVVLSLLAAGPGADREEVTALARSFDEIVG